MCCSKKLSVALAATIPLVFLVVGCPGGLLPTSGDGDGAAALPDTPGEDGGSPPDESSSGHRLTESTSPEENANVATPRDGQWFGTISQGGTIRFRVSNGGTTVSDFFLEYEYRAMFPGGLANISRSVSWDTPEDVFVFPLPPQGVAMFGSAKSTSSTVVSLAGAFDTPTQASGSAGVTFLDDTSGQDLDLDWTAALP